MKTSTARSVPTLTGAKTQSTNRSVIQRFLAALLRSLGALAV